MSLIISISGIRGVVGESLTPETAVIYSKAFAEYCLKKTPQSEKCKIIIGRDGRITGKILTNIISSTLLSMGCDVIAIGICPTPTVALAVQNSDAIGGIAVTASHNPMQWNGLKFFNQDGSFLDFNDIEKVLSIVKNPELTYVSWEKTGTHQADPSWIQKHIDAVLSLYYLDIEKIKSRKFRIVVDCINSAGGVIVPQLLKILGCDVIEMNCDISGVFSRTPEPLPENLTDLAVKVKQEKADLGIAVDPDVDRLVLIDENGIPFGEEYTIVSVVNYVFGCYLKNESKKNDMEINIVVNLSTTRAIDDIAKKYGVKVYRTPVGEKNVSNKMKDVNAIVGGEGNGGIILPAVHYCRDAIVGIGIVLQMLAEFGGKLSELKASFPQYFITKDKVVINSMDSCVILSKIIEKYNKSGKVNIEDGVKIDFEDSWVHLRKSNTEPIIRIIAEAKSIEEANRIATYFRKEIVTLLTSTF